MACKYAKDSVYITKGKYSKNAKEASFIKEGDNGPLSKTATMNPLPRMATGLGVMMSLLPQGQLAMYVMQDDDEPLATKGLRTAYTVQGNDKPLTTKSDWATTFNDHEGAKAPTVKLIVPVMIPHHCIKASYCLQ
jgi:hypothetical protein